MKTLCYLAVLLLTATTLTAQNVKLKKSIVYVAENPTFSFEKKIMGNELYVYKLNSNEELMNIIVDNNKTESIVDDSKQITFTEQKIKVISKDFRNRSYEFLLALLFEEKVIDLKGEINADNLKRFKLKYDDGNVNHVNKH